CGGDIIEVRARKRGGKTFYGCSRYNDETGKCDFKIWQKPLNEPGPQCGAKVLVMGGTRAKPMIAGGDKECGYKRPVAPGGEGGTPPLEGQAPEANQPHA